MIGKKGMAWIVAGTATVAVGVPAGIVISQQVAKHESLDSKMTKRWSDIERELQTSFGGFELRDKDIVDSKRKIAAETASTLDKSQLLVKRAIGVGVPEYDPTNANANSAFYNNIAREQGKISTYMTEYFALFHEIIETIVSEDFVYDVATQNIVNKQASESKVNSSYPGNTGGVQMQPVKQNDKWTLNNIAATDGTNSVSASWLGSLNVIIQPDLESQVAGKAPVTVLIDKNEFLNIFSSRTGMVAFNNAFKAILDQSNIFDVDRIAAQMITVLSAPATDSGSIQAIISGSSNQSITSSFGLRTLISNLKTMTKAFADENVSNWERRLNNVVTKMSTLLIESRLSILGHHDQKLNNKYITNLLNNPAGKGLIDKDFQTEVLDNLNTTANLDPELTQIVANPDDATFYAMAVKDDERASTAGNVDASVLAPLNAYVDNWNKTALTTSKKDEAQDWLAKFIAMHGQAEQSWLTHAGIPTDNPTDEPIMVADAIKNAKKLDDLRIIANKFNDEIAKEVAKGVLHIGSFSFPPFQEGTMFNNDEVTQWQKEGGNYPTIDTTTNVSSFAPGENIQMLGATIRDSKVKNIDATDWLLRNQFALVWNEQKFEDVVNKYNLSMDDLYVDIDTNGEKHTLTNHIGGGVSFANAFETELVNPATVKLTDFYPLASPEWIGTGFKIAQRGKTDLSVQGALAANVLSDLKLTQESKITFRLKINNNEINKSYINTLDRRQIVFGINADGELFEDDEAVRR